MGLVSQLLEGIFVFVPPLGGMSLRSRMKRQTYTVLNPVMAETEKGKTMCFWGALILLSCSIIHSSILRDQLTWGL